MSAVLTALAGGGVPACEHTVAGAPSPDARVELRLSVRARVASGGLTWVNRDGWLPPGRRRVLDHAACARVHGSTQEDADTVAASLRSWGFDVLDADLARRLIRAVGRVADAEAAFGVRLELHESQGSAHLGRSGPILLPPRMVGVVRGVHGLDGCTRPSPLATADTELKAARPTRRRVEAALGLPPDGDAPGVCVALAVPAGGLHSAALASCGVQAGDVEIVGPLLDQATTRQSGWSLAVGMQVQVLRLAVPGARIAVHVGPEGEVGAIETLTAAIHDAQRAPRIVLAGWGAPEAAWSPQAMTVVEQHLLTAAAMGVTVVCAATPATAVFPASAPHALAVAPAPRTRGGKPLAATRSESRLFPAPAWQRRRGAPPDELGSRALPDAVASGSVGWQVADGEAVIDLGGPAAAAAGWAAVLAVVAGRRGVGLGLVPPLLQGDQGGPGAPAAADAQALLARIEEAEAQPTPERTTVGAEPPALSARQSSTW